MNNIFLQSLFSDESNVRAFTPHTYDSGNKLVAPLRINPVLKYKGLDVGCEYEPNLKLDIAVIKDVTEKLLFYVLFNGYRAGEEIPAHIMEYILDEDYGLLVALYSDTGKLACALYFDLYSRLSAPSCTLYSAFHEFERVFRAINDSGHMLTEYTMPGESKPRLSVIRNKRQ